MSFRLFCLFLTIYIYRCVFFRPHVHILFTHSHYLAFLYIYICTSSHISFHTLIVVDTLDANLGNSHIFCQSYGNESIVIPRLLASGIFMTYFHCVRNAFLSPTSFFMSVDVVLFYKRHFIPSYFFEGRPDSMVVAHPAGSQV